MTTHASEHQCCMENCDRQAVAFWPCVDPDIPMYPYCRQCLDERKQAAVAKFFEGWAE